MVTVLDLACGQQVNGADCRPSLRDGRDGAIAQLGERIVRNDEVGGSIPPGSTTSRRSPRGVGEPLCEGGAIRSHVPAGPEGCRRLNALNVHSEKLPQN